MVDDGCKPICFFFFFSGVVGDPPEVCMFWGPSASCVGETCFLMKYIYKNYMLGGFKVFF